MKKPKKEFVEDLSQTEDPPDKILFKCIYCDYVILFPRQGHYDGDQEISVKGMKAATEGCPNCGKLNQELHDKVMVVKKRIKR